MTSETSVAQASTLSPAWDRIPQELRERAQWALAGPDKAPRTVSGTYASVTDPATWTDFDSACASATERGWHIGYVLTADDPFACIDFDVKDDTTPEQVQTFNALVHDLNSYSELSRSGKGMHVWVRGKIGPGCKRDRIELYSQERFIICTGNVYADKPIEDRQEVILNVASGMRGTDRLTPITDEPERETDDVIIERAMRAANAEKFIALARGEWQGKAEYPSQSEADYAMLAILAFYSPNNEQVRRIFRMTELGKREKATKNDRYIDLTLKSLRGQQAQKQEQYAAIAEAMKPAIDAAMLIAQRFKFKQIGRGTTDTRNYKPPSMDLNMMRHSLVHVYDKQTYVAFRDYPDIYTSEHAMRSMLRHNKTTIKVEGEDVEFPTFELWLKDEHRNMVHTMTFDPRAGEFCSDVDEKRHALNLWRPRTHATPDNWQARVQPFLDHAAFLIPVNAEREAFLDWLAHAEQRPGELPHFHYLMYTPSQGIGRNCLAYAMARVWTGHVALDFDLKQTLERGFNGQLSRAVLAVVDEIREGHQSDGWRHAQKLKSMITTRVRHINEKYGLQRSELNCCRWLLFSNYESALPLEEADRRWNVVRNPDTPKSPEYYERLYKLLDDDLYIASIREFLRQRDISKFNPGARAVMNEAKFAVVSMSLSEEDERARDLVASRPGDQPPAPSDLIEGSELFEHIYDLVSTNMVRQEQMSKTRLLRKIAEGAGIKKYPHKVYENRGKVYIWILRNQQFWTQQQPEYVRAALRCRTA